MYQFAVAQQTSREKLPTFVQSFQTEVRALKANEANITTENSFSPDHFGIQDNHESHNDEKTLFQVFLQISDPSINPQIAKYVCLSLLSIT